MYCAPLAMWLPPLLDMRIRQAPSFVQLRLCGQTQNCIAHQFCVQMCMCSLNPSACVHAMLKWCLACMAGDSIDSEASAPAMISYALFNSIAIRTVLLKELRLMGCAPIGFKGPDFGMIHPDNFPGVLQDGHYEDKWGIYHRVLNAVIETPPGQDCFGWLDVYDDSLELTGIGGLESATVRLSSKQTKVSIEQSS